MKIGIVMYQTSNSKGQEIVAQNMVREFRKLAHDAYLITSPYHDGERVVPVEFYERSLEGYFFTEESDLQTPLIRVNGYLSSWPPRRIMFHYFTDILRRIVDRFELDALITHSTLWNGPEDVANYILWRRTIRELGLHREEVIYCHMPHFQPPDPIQYPISERAFRMAWNRLVLPQIFRTANSILVTTPIEEEHMMRLGAKEAQCFLYPAAVDEGIFQLHKDASFEHFRKKHGIPEGAKIISYLGTVEARKNPLAVVKVAKKLRHVEDVHFVIAGRGSNQESAVREEMRGLTNVSYIGEVDDREKVQLIKGSYLNVLLSRMEALGIVQLEFMYVGVPVITSAVGGQRWVVRPEVDGIHVKGPEDVDGAYKAIKFLIENPDKRDEMGKKATERAQKFTLSYTTRELEQKLLSFR